VRIPLVVRLSFGKLRVSEFPLLVSLSSHKLRMSEGLEV